MSQIFRPYSEIPMILEQAATKNQHIATALKQYILQFAGDFTELKDKLSKLATDPLVDPEKRQENKDDQEFHSELFKAFPYIAIDHLLQIPSYEVASEKLKKYAEAKISQSAAEYTQRNSSLRQKFEDELKNYAKIKKMNDDANNAYKDAGFLLQQAEQKKDPNLADFQKKFVEARTKAIEANQQACQQVEGVTQNMESLLTQFEELEKWRGDELKGILLSFSSTLIEIANNFVIGSSKMNDAVSEIPMVLDSHVIARFESFRTAETDDFFQVWPVNTLVTKYLDSNFLFQADVAKGCQLFVCKEAYIGPSGHLNCQEGEIVCGLEQKGDCVLCKNINESVGLLPKSILEFPK